LFFVTETKRENKRIISSRSFGVQTALLEVVKANHGAMVSDLKRVLAEKDAIASAFATEQLVVQRDLASKLREANNALDARQSEHEAQITQLQITQRQRDRELQLQVCCFGLNFQILKAKQVADWEEKTGALSRQVQQLDAQVCVCDLVVLKIVNTGFFLFR
jgi:hypothetical protein